MTYFLFFLSKIKIFYLLKNNSMEVFELRVSNLSRRVIIIIKINEELLNGYFPGF